jgi:hypothetical protein
MCVRAIDEKDRHLGAPSLQGGSATVSQPPAPRGVLPAMLNELPRGLKVPESPHRGLPLDRLLRFQ